MKDNNCTNQIAYGVVPQGDSDISGIGVILAFVISAYVTLSAVILAYCCGFVEEELLSPIDRRIFFVRPYTSKHPRIHEAVRHAVMALGDQQIVTGWAIMAAGFQGLRMGTISTYHFQIVLYLAWMSSSVHLSALTLLGSFLRRHKGLLVWRLSGMLVLLVLLIIGLVPTFSNAWGSLFPAKQNQTEWIWDELANLDKLKASGWGVPAACFWGTFRGYGVSPDAVLGMILLIVSYAWKVGTILDSMRMGYREWIYHPLENLLVGMMKRSARQHVHHNGKYSLWYFRLLLCLTLPGFMLLEFFSSFAASIWLSALGLVFGTLEIMEPREQAGIFIGDKENHWQFGQLVPLLLLIQPIGAVAEYLWVPKDEEDGRRSSVAARSSSPPRRPCSELDTPLPILIDFVAGTSQWQLSQHERHLLQAIIFDSKTFAALIYLFQAGLVAASCWTMWWDSATIGLVTTQNWYIIIICVPIATGAALLFNLVVLPYSRLGKPSKCAGGSGRDEIEEQTHKGEEEHKRSPTRR